MFKKLLLLLTLMCCATSLTFASEGGEGKKEEAKPAGIGYYTLDPEFITNYVTNGPTLGYVRVKVDLMIDNAGDIELLKKHEPLIRDAITTELGTLTLDQVCSQDGRETARQTLKKQIMDLLTKEEERPVIRDLLFTNFLYQ